MGRSVAVQPFQFHRDVERAPYHRLGIARRLQARLLGDRLRQGDGRRRIVRHQLGELVDLAVGHFQHTADVAEHAARLQGAEGDDLPDLVAPVTLLHVIDHLAATLLAEIDVEVRHGHAFRIEEALEQQARDGERIGDERTGTRAAAWSDRDSLRLRPLDEVCDDQEVARIFHALDDAELEVEPLAVIVDRASRCETERLDAPRQPFVGLPAQLRGFVYRRAIFGGEARQDRLTNFWTEQAALGNLHRGRERLR